MKSQFVAAAAALLILASLTLASVGFADSAPISGIQTADMDTKVRPQDDLFAYANGTWLREVPIPPDRSSYGVDSLMTEHSLVQQRDLIEAAQTSADPEVRKVSDLYSSYLNEPRVERAGTKPLQPELRRIAIIKRASDLGALLAHLDRIGIPSPIGTAVRPDSKHSTQYAFWLTQNGLGLPDRDYYLSDDVRLIGFRTKYREHVEKMLHLLGDSAAAGEADKVLALETAIAKIQWN